MYLHQTIFIYNDGKLVCRGAGDFHLAAELEGAEPSWSFPPAAVPPLTDEEQSSESRRKMALHREFRRGDFVLRTTNLRSWIAADATHLHQTIFIPLGLIPRPLGRLFVLCFFHFCVRLVYEPYKSGRNTAWFAARIACSEAKILL